MKVYYSKCIQRNALLAKIYAMKLRKAVYLAWKQYLFHQYHHRFIQTCQWVEETRLANSWNSWRQVYQERQLQYKTNVRVLQLKKRRCLRIWYDIWCYTLDMKRKIQIIMKKRWYRPAFNTWREKVSHLLSFALSYL
jgi:hypothetical protein